MISDDDAAELAQLRRSYQESAADTNQLLLAYYRKLVATSDAGATHEEIAAVLGVGRSRITQQLQQARNALG